ncbi:hypothetical protein [Loigolactobacillus jiayinensis]|uniref:DUF3899 domain-containing protein n=1 Tax=Loigolactobacillus jiayinensis TaxID=2486016 RepID=A0ABW1REC0_9LACO|nr:hypothetical protein [Loigolactobacillus jiayinensis]
MIKKISWVSLIISFAFALLLAFLSDKGTPLLNLSNNLFLIGLFILIIAIILYLYDAHLFRHLWLRRHKEADTTPATAEQPAFYTELRRVFLWLGLGEIIVSIVLSFL